MNFDVVIVGAGPAGLSAAIRLKQLALAAGRDLSVVVIEKAASPGGHTLSGAVFDPCALDQLLPDWRALNAPLTQPVTEDALVFFGASGGYRSPVLPRCSQNHGNFIISLGALTRWLAAQAEGLGVELFCGFAASELLYDHQNAVIGVATGDMGVGRDGQPGPNYQRGMALLGKYTLLAEGSRGHLGRQVTAKWGLDQGSDPQSYGLGIKELWQIDPARHQPGLVLHTAGWPLDDATYGGSFLYHAADNLVALGFVTGLNYQNPYLSPFEEFQRWKTHPHIGWYLQNTKSQVTAKRLAYGARSITAGGLLSLPKLVFAGGALLGCDAGFLNIARIKGSHTAMLSGMMAAQAAFDAVAQGRSHDVLADYPAAFESSPMFEELDRARNFKAWFKYGTAAASLMNGIEQWGLRGHVPWTIHRHQSDPACLWPAAQCQPIDYPKPDGVLTFDRSSSVHLSNTHHAEDQPVHLTLKDPQVPVAVNLAQFAGPEARYCPAGVYEFVRDSQGTDRLQINAANCLHCKTCDIKDPTQNIVWVSPEGGGGPNYTDM